LFFLFLKPHMYLAHRGTDRIRDVHILDDRLGWRLKPGSTGTHFSEGNFDVTYAIDEKGRRKIENHAVSTPAIFFFGDSFTFGHGVAGHQTYTAIIKSRLPGIAVYNLGVMGYGIVHLYEKLTQTLDEIRPGDTVVFAPLSSNISRNIKEFIVPFVTYCTSANLKFQYYPRYNSPLVDAVRMQDTIVNRLKFYLLTAPLLGRVTREFHRRYLIPDTTLEARDMIERARQMVLSKGGRFRLYFLPTVQECRKREYHRDISVFTYTDIMNFFPKEADALEALRFSTDPHWNDKGHAIAARAILATLAESEKETL
ncbi:MAG: SGNH/GDSL hydrolase family protein, partial [Desulfobacterales bacterium]|nr:SGNH/GDSL hydrolase family protein [Desulfobacterales bacterium]